jgi:5-methylcytosine-specific restriction endonuclease McrA
MVIHVDNFPGAAHLQTTAHAWKRSILRAEKFRPEADADVDWQVISEAVVRAHGSMGHRLLTRQSALEAKGLLREQVHLDDRRPLTTYYIEGFHGSPLLQVGEARRLSATLLAGHLHVLDGHISVRLLAAAAAAAAASYASEDVKDATDNCNAGPSRDAERQSAAVLHSLRRPAMQHIVCRVAYKRWQADGSSHHCCKLGDPGDTMEHFKKALPIRNTPS